MNNHSEKILKNQKVAIKRTLFLTIGSIAQEAGSLFAGLLKNRNGPEMAIAVVNIDETANDDAFLQTIATTLTRISPPDLMTRLAEKGWQLANTPDIHLVIIADAAMSAEAKPFLTQHLDAVTTQVYKHLGIEASSSLIWLVGEDSQEGVLCLPVTESIILLGLRNESGLRLPDDDTLAAICAEMLWCLHLTPLQAVPMRVTSMDAGYASGQPPMYSIGLHGWEWSPKATLAAFTQRWIATVFAHWLSRSEAEIPVETAATWLQEQHLSREHFTKAALDERTGAHPDFIAATAQTPAPWHLPHLFESLRFLASTDEEQQTQSEQNGWLYATDLLDDARHKLQVYVQQLLDEEPVGGVAKACSWLQAVSDSCEQQIEDTYSRETVLSETGEHLAAMRGELEARLVVWLTEWPQSQWPHWTGIGIRPWRWPKLMWRYWQMWQSLRQLSHILTQQSTHKRQIISNLIARRGLVELEKITRHIYGQVDEIGDMLQALVHENGRESSGENTSHASSMPMIALPVPDKLYEQLVPDANQEAIAAAEAIGGLGQQVTKLDDAIWEPLLKLGAKRLKGVWELTAVDAFAAWVGSQEQLQLQWEAGWSAAQPLWRLDEAMLNESVRTQQDSLFFACGKDVQLFEHLLDEIDQPVEWLPFTDPARIWLLRMVNGVDSNW